MSLSTNLELCWISLYCKCEPLMEQLKCTACLSLDLSSQVIYLLLDIMYSYPNKEGASVESFPIAFAIPIGLVKLVQGLWLLDHNDHQVGGTFFSLNEGTERLLKVKQQQKHHYLYICILAVQQLWTWFLWYFAPFRVHSNCSYIQQLLSVSLSGSTSGSCMHWCARASTQSHYVTFMSWSPPFPPHPKPNSACRYCYTTGKKSDELCLEMQASWQL